MPHEWMTREEWQQKAQLGTSPGPMVKTFTGEVVKDLHTPGSRVRTFRITTGSVDRMGDVIDPAGWQVENFIKAGGPVLFAHDYGSLPVGKTLALRGDAHGLMAEVEFAPREVYEFADTVLGLIDFGALKATSVGFDPIEWTYNEQRKGYDFLKSELLEFSIVPVPANAEALQMAMKSMGAERVAPFRKWVEDAAAALKIEKAGRVLSAANEKRIRAAMDMHTQGVQQCQEVLDLLPQTETAMKAAEPVTPPGFTDLGFPGCRVLVPNDGGQVKSPQPVEPKPERYVFDKDAHVFFTDGVPTEAHPYGAKAGCCMPEVKAEPVADEPTDLVVIDLDSLKATEPQRLIFGLEEADALDVYKAFTEEIAAEKWRARKTALTGRLD